MPWPKGKPHPGAFGRGKGGAKKASHTGSVKGPAKSKMITSALSRGTQNSARVSQTRRENAHRTKSPREGLDPSKVRAKLDAEKRSRSTSLNLRVAVHEQKQRQYQAVFDTHSKQVRTGYGSRSAGKKKGDAELMSSRFQQLFGEKGSRRSYESHELAAIAKGSLSRLDYTPVRHKWGRL